MKERESIESMEDVKKMKIWKLRERKMLNRRRGEN